MEKEGKSESWNELQKFMIKNREENVITIAQTGMGKTEAGLLWIGNNKGFFTLPLRTAINAIYDRIRNKIVLDKIGERVGLLHSDAFSEYIKREDDENKLELEEIGLSQYYEKNQTTNNASAICTIDQLFDLFIDIRVLSLNWQHLLTRKLLLMRFKCTHRLIAYLVSGLSHVTNLGGSLRF